MFLFAPATLDRMLQSMSSTGTTPLHLIHLCGRRVTLVKCSNTVLKGRWGGGRGVGVGKGGFARVVGARLAGV